MRLYILSLAAGVLVGVIIRSPAPPVVALVGLLGILIGEQAIPMAKRLAAGHALHIGWFKSECIPHVFGHMSKASAAIPVKTEEKRT